MDDHQCEKQYVEKSGIRLLKKSEIYKDVDDINDFIEKMLVRPKDFGLNLEHEHYKEMFVTWSLGPTIEHRDSSLIETCNSAVIQKFLTEECSALKAYWMITECNHWAVGWVKHLSFRAKNKRGPSKMAYVVKYILSQIDQYCILDEDLYYIYEQNAAIQSVITCCRKYVLENVSIKEGRQNDDWAEKVYCWLNDNHPSELENRDGQGASPDEEIVIEGLKKFGFYDLTYDT